MASIAIDWPMRRRLAMVAIGYLPIVQIVTIVATSYFIGQRCASCGVATGVTMLYLLPPMMYRLASIVFAVEPGRHRVSSSAFLRWWLSAQWQVIFNRLPMLDELLRLVPGLYSMWLRLWGAKVGSLVYWSPGLAVLDRPFVNIGSRVVFGAGVRVNPHIIVSGNEREAELWIAPITLGDDSLIGGYSLLTSGVTVPPGQSIAAGKYVRPFAKSHHAEAAYPISEDNPL
jgi:hypothetical protein